MAETDYLVKLHLRIDWSELDYFGHVNNVSFFKYIQASRVHYWDTIGLTKFHKDNSVGPMLVSCTCDFKQPLFYPGNITVLTRTEFIKNTSFGFCHRMIDENGRTAAEAQDVMVMFDFNSNTKALFPQLLREKIEDLESRKF
ncbi:MAG: acyl-CoA thioesterase [Pyrinomonadaceae bacterium]